MVCNMKYTPRLFLFVAIFICNAAVNAQQAAAKSFYLNNTGNDEADGSINHPWQTIARLNREILQPGDKVYLRGGQVFTGTVIVDKEDYGKKNRPVVFTSYGDGYASINSADSSAIIIQSSSFIRIEKIKCFGSGRKNGNTRHGLVVLYSSYVTIENAEVSGYQKAGVMVYESDSVKVSNVHAHDNGFAGIAADGAYQQRKLSRVHIVDCFAENNPGDPTNLENHSGNGIIAGNGKNILIEYCSATNNGWDMPRVGNGPVGIWCYETDSLTIQYCIAYRNKTSKGGGDGGGFDLDGGVTHSVIQYCLSYENEGSGYGIFQYAGASNWHDNTIRFCISENDGTVSPAGAGIFIWNGAGDSAQFKRCLFYNNTVYNERGAALSYEAASLHTAFGFYNNIFVGKDSLIIGKCTNTNFLANNWYSLVYGFNNEGYQSFSLWAKEKNRELLNGKIVGVNKAPNFKMPGIASITDPRQLKSFFNYQNRQSNRGINLSKHFDISTGSVDFNGLILSNPIIGACK